MEAQYTLPKPESRSRGAGAGRRVLRPDHRQVPPPACRAIMPFMRRICTSDNGVIIGHVRQVLDNHAIPCIVRNDFLAGGAGELPVNETWPEIWVIDDRDFDRARALVDAIVATAHASDPPWRCTSCGELVEGQFTDCWRCGAAGPGHVG